MSLNSSAAQPPLSPQQQDTGLPAALPPDTPDVANPSEPEQTEPVLANRSANNSSAELAVELNQPPTLIAEHSAPEKSDRSSSASLEAESAITDDEITSLKKAAEQGNAEAQYKLLAAKQDINARSVILSGNGTQREITLPAFASQDGIVPDTVGLTPQNNANGYRRAPITARAPSRPSAAVPVAATAGSAGASTSETNASGVAGQAATTVPLQAPQIVPPTDANRR